MRIGILTFHCAYNFGAMLQCYALQEFISSLGYKVWVINYRPSYLDAKPITLKSILRHPIRFCEQIITGRMSFLRKRFRKFKNFETQYYNLTKECRDKRELEVVIKDFDIVFFGSDQIWCEKFNGKDTIWYGDLFKNRGMKFVSYAASAGDVVFSPVGVKLMNIMQSQFDSISVRESKLNSYLGGKSTIVLDPTLLVPNSIYEKLYNNSKIINQNYILVRQARQDDNIYRIARIIAKQLNAIIVTADVHKSGFKYSDRLLCCSPADFVGLVKNALCVVSNSFHGITMSISCHTPFYAIRVNDDGDGRIVDLLNKLNLSCRLLEKNSNPIFDVIDYSKVENDVEKLRIDSQNFIIDSIK